MRTLFAFILILIIPISSFAQKELSLKQAIQIALHKNSSIQKGLNNLESSESNVKQSYGNFLPTLGLGASWDWTRSDVSGFGTVVIGGVQVPSFAVTTQTRNYQWNINTNWTLFDVLANLATLSNTKNELKSSKLSLERLKQDIVFQTSSLYYDIINNQQQLKVNKDNLKWNKKNLETIRERNKLGAATLADVYQQEVATGNSELELIKTSNSFEIAKSNLLFYLGLDVLEEYVFSDTLTTEESEILNTDLSKDYKNLSDIVDNALNSRLDYKSAQLNLESAVNGVTIAKSGHLPRLVANGFYTWRGDNINDIDRSKTLSVGLSLNIPIFTGWSVDNRVQFAKVDMKNKEVELNDLQRDIKRQIQTTYLDLQAAQKGLTVSQSNVASAGENLKIEQERYSLGASKLLDVLVANSNYTKALSDLINAQFAYIVLSKKLKYYLGVLDYSKYE